MFCPTICGIDAMTDVNRLMSGGGMTICVGFSLSASDCPCVRMLNSAFGFCGWPSGPSGTPSGGGVCGVFVVNPLLPPMSWEPPAGFPGNRALRMSCLEMLGQMKSPAILPAKIPGRSTTVMKSPHGKLMIFSPIFAARSTPFR
jgi:hypothetical protein